MAEATSCHPNGSAFSFYMSSPTSRIYITMLQLCFHCFDPTTVPAHGITVKTALMWPPVTLRPRDCKYEQLCGNDSHVFYITIMRIATIFTSRTDAICFSNNQVLMFMHSRIFLKGTGAFYCVNLHKPYVSNYLGKPANTSITQCPPSANVASNMESRDLETMNISCWLWLSICILPTLKCFCEERLIKNWAARKK